MSEKNEWKAEAPDLTARLTAGYVCLLPAQPATFLIWNLAEKRFDEAIDLYSLIDRPPLSDAIGTLPAGNEIILKATERIYKYTLSARPSRFMKIFEICKVGVEQRLFVVCTGGKPKAGPR